MRTSVAPSSARAGGWVGPVLGVLVLAVIVAALAWKATGGGYFPVSTPSMGTAAPVGSLVITEPVPAGRAVHIGELIAFRPPGADAVFTHRVRAITPDGLIRTRGDVNGATDGWQLSRNAVIGTVIAVVPGAGWLLRALPILAVGLLLVWALTRRWVLAPYRASARASGALAVGTVAIALLHPLFGASVISFRRAGATAVGSVVSTGLLPVRVTAWGGTSERITSGQVAHVSTRRPGADGRYALRASPDVEPWWAVPLVLLSLVPGLLSLSVVESADPVEPAVR